MDVIKRLTEIGAELDQYHNGPGMNALLTELCIVIDRLKIAGQDKLNTLLEDNPLLKSEDSINHIDNIIKSHHLVLWPNLKNTENLNPEFMSHDFVDMLNEFAGSLNTQFYMNRGAETSGHSTRSQHYKRPCETADFYSKDIALDRLFYFAHTFQSSEGETFGAIGAYPFWNNPGLHIDMREDRVYWYRDAKGKYHYEFEAILTEEKLSEIVDQQNLEIDFCDAEF
jgi:hypothetical protein